MTKLDFNYNSFIYPWERNSVFERLKVLEDSSAKLKIVYIYEGADNSTFRYRVNNVCDVINQNKEKCATYFFVHEISLILEHIKNISFLVFARVRWSNHLSRLFCRAEACKVRILFDVDDLIYDVAKVPLIMDTLRVGESEADYNYWFSYVARMFLAAKHCHGYIATNTFLAKKMADCFGKNAQVIPNFINEKQLEVSKLLWHEKFANKNAKKRSRILLGYFSGSYSHDNDFMSITSDIIELMERNHNVCLRIVGYLNLADGFQKFIESGRVERLPIQNYLDLQVKIAECDINLIPLQLNEFTNCKSEIKYFEAAIVGTLTIAAPTAIYREIIDDGVNAKLAMPGEWGEIIKEIIEQKKREQTNAMLYQARDHAETEYFGSRVNEKIDSIFS